MWYYNKNNRLLNVIVWAEKRSLEVNQEVTTTAACPAWEQPPDQVAELHVPASHSFLVITLGEKLLNYHTDV